MSNGVQITLIVCGTLVILMLMLRSALTGVVSSDKEHFVFIVRFPWSSIVLARGKGTAAQTARTMLKAKGESGANSAPGEGVAAGESEADSALKEEPAAAATDPVEDKTE